MSGRHGGLYMDTEFVSVAAIEWKPAFGLRLSATLADVQLARCTLWFEPPHCTASIMRVSYELLSCVRRRWYFLDGSRKESGCVPRERVKRSSRRMKRHCWVTTLSPFITGPSVTMKGITIAFPIANSLQMKESCPCKHRLHRVLGEPRTIPN